MSTIGTLDKKLNGSWSPYSGCHMFRLPGLLKGENVTCKILKSL